jgi:hypothetical protein
MVHDEQEQEHEHGHGHDHEHGRVQPAIHAFKLPISDSTACIPSATTATAQVFRAQAGASRPGSREHITVEVPCDKEELTGNTEFISCPLRCGEAVHVEELAYHMELHDFEGSPPDGAGRRLNSRDASPLPIAIKSASSDALNVRERPKSGGSRSIPTKQAMSSAQLLRTNPHRSKKANSSSALKSLFEPPPRATRTSHKSTPSGIRRLGVSHLLTS